MAAFDLTGSIVGLEALTLAHAPDLATAAAESRDTYGLTVVPSGLDEATAYVQHALDNREQTAFATRLLATDQIVGSTRFSWDRWTWPDGDPRQRTDRPDVAEIGYTWLAASAQRTGINTEAKYLMMCHAFEGWDVHAVRLRTDVRNQRSRSAIERLGATFDGVQRSDMPGADGTVRDSAYFSVIAAEWPGVKKHLQALLAR